MKYSESYKKSRFKGSAAFYIIIAFCLIAVGGASWFAVSNFKEKAPDDNSSISSLPKSEPEPSSIAEPSAITPSQDVSDTVSDEPYTSSKASEPQVTASRPAPTVFSMPVEGEILKGYSDKELQYSATYGDMRIHSGIDIACAEGTSVSACANGLVISLDESTELGKTVTIDHGNGITAKYASLKEIAVKAGDKVTAGDIIGTVTTVPSECADQSHLHIEVYKNGHSASPIDTLNNN